MSIFRRRKPSCEVTEKSCLKEDNWTDRKVMELEEKLDLLAKSQGKYFARGARFELREFKLPESGQNSCCDGAV